MKLSSLLLFTLLTLFSAFSLLESHSTKPQMHPLTKYLKSKKISKKWSNLVDIFLLFCRLQNKHFHSQKEWEFRLKVFKKNLDFFIRKEDDVKDRILVKHEKDKTFLQILPDKRLSVDFYDDDQDDPTIFELNKFAILTEKEIDNMFHLDESFFNEKNLEKNELEVSFDSKDYGLKPIQEYIRKMEKKGNTIDPNLKKRYISNDIDPREEEQEVYIYSDTTPHFSTLDSSFETFLNGADINRHDSPVVTHKNFFNNLHPRILYTKINIPSTIRNISVDGHQVPTYLDWKKLGAMTPVKNQFKCNACYAFAGLAAIETHYKIKTGSTVSLSEQEVVDCSPENNACRGGLPHYVFDYVKDNGVAYESDYPYVKRKDTCNKPNSSRWPGYHIRGHRMLEKGVVNLIKELRNGPMATVSYASFPFKLYKGGLFVGQGCFGKSRPNHASILIGYNLLGSSKYMHFKNGWGVDWGKRGYYKVKLGDLNNRNLSHCLLAATKYNAIPMF